MEATLNYHLTSDVIKFSKNDSTSVTRMNLTASHYILHCQL